MKKLVSAIAIIVIAISLVGCGKNFKSFESTGNYDDNAYPRFLSTDWGMTEDEVFKALGIKREDIPTDKIYKDGEFAGYEVPMLVNKEPISVGLQFLYGKDGDSTKNLGLVKVQFAVTTKEMKSAIEAFSAKPEFTKKDAYTIYSEKDLFEKRVALENEVMPRPEGIRESSDEEWNNSLKDVLKQELSVRYIADASISEVLDENGEIPKDMPFGLAVFNGKNLAQIRLLEGK